VSNKQAFLDRYESSSNLGLFNASNATKGQREAAIKVFEDLGIPTGKVEYWKYNKLNAVFSDFDINTVDASEKDVDTASYTIADLDTYTVVIVNGEYQADLSNIEGLGKGVSIEDLAVASQGDLGSFSELFGEVATNDNRPFIALNTALHLGGVFIKVDDEVALDKPIHVKYVTNVANKALLFRSAQISATSVRQKQNSLFKTHTVISSGVYVRNNLFIHPDGEGCETHLNGLYLTEGKQFVDNHTYVDHAMPNCESHEMYKGILDDSSQGIFNGKLFVRVDAQKTNAFQSSRSLLLSDDAAVYSKPELEIYADDVKCSHGATTGHLDHDALFYFQARGIPEIAARNLLLHAFSEEVTSLFDLEPIRDHANTLVSGFLD